MFKVDDIISPIDGAYQVWYNGKIIRYDRFNKEAGLKLNNGETICGFNLDKVDELLKIADSLIWQEIEKLVIEVLESEDNHAKSFVCAMGGYFWVDYWGDSMEHRPFMNEIDDLFDEYNEAFKLTGVGVRWDLDINNKAIKSVHW